MPNTIPDLGYTPVADIFKLPAGVNFGPCSGIAVNAKNNVLVFNRSGDALMEFTSSGDYVRTMGRGIFTNPHGLRIDREGNIWATDTAAHIVVKMNADGRILMVLGVAGRAGEWHHAGHLKCFDEPNDLAFGPKGEVYITQGHGKAESLVHNGTGVVRRSARPVGYALSASNNSSIVRPTHVSIRCLARAGADRYS